MSRTNMERLEWSLWTHAGLAPNVHGKGKVDQCNGLSKTDRMRDYLRQHGHARAITLAMEADLASSSLVNVLLSADIKKGRVFVRDGQYFWNPSFDESLHQEIQRAKALLLQYGYVVRRRGKKG